MNPAETLKHVENSLRDIFNYILSKKMGNNWHSSCGISESRVKQWKERKNIDEKKFGQSDPRLIYYSDFYDLKTILKKSWAKGLSEVFKELREVEVLLDILEDLRNTNAHHREFLPYQKHLITGIGGKLQTQITEYFSKMETGESYYPRIESARNSLGDTWCQGETPVIKSTHILRPGDKVQFSTTGFDPLGEELEFGLLASSASLHSEWNKSGDFDLVIQNKHVTNCLSIVLAVKSNRDFHPSMFPTLGPIDDKVMFQFVVLPPRQ